MSNDVVRRLFMYVFLLLLPKTSILLRAILRISHDESYLVWQIIWQNSVALKIRKSTRPEERNTPIHGEVSALGIQTKSCAWARPFRFTYYSFYIFSLRFLYNVFSKHFKKKTLIQYVFFFFLLFGGGGGGGVMKPLYQANGTLTGPNTCIRCR